MQSILIFGTPRAGTSWLAKIFDSHPNVIYRHEPDEIRPNKSIPYFCAPDDYPRFASEAAAYIEQLIGITTTKTVGTLPIFSKAYRSPTKQLLHLLSIFALRVPEATAWGARVVREIPVPFFGRAEALKSPLVVIKTVSMLDRAGLLTRAVRDVRTIVIIRDPVGFVASQLRGIRLGKFAETSVSDDIARTDYARRLGLTPESFQRMPLVDQLAWEWRLYNDKALGDLADCANARLVLHRELVTDAEWVVRELFAFAGLEFGPETQNFLYQSQNAPPGARRYHSVYRGHNFKNHMDDWQGVLTEAEFIRIGEIVNDSASGRLIAWSRTRSRTGASPPKGMPAPAMANLLTLAQTT